MSFPLNHRIVKFLEQEGQLALIVRWVLQPANFFHELIDACGSGLCEDHHNLGQSSSRTQISIGVLSASESSKPPSFPFSAGHVPLEFVLSSSLWSSTVLTSQLFLILYISRNGTGTTGQIYKLCIYILSYKINWNLRMRLISIDKCYIIFPYPTDSFACSWGICTPWSHLLIFVVR